QGGFLLGVAVGQGVPISWLLASQNQPLLIRGDRRGLCGKGLVAGGYRGGCEKASTWKRQPAGSVTTPQAQHKMQGGLLLDVVVRQGAPIFQLFASKDEPLLIRWNAFLVLDLGLDVLNGVTGFNFQGDGLARQGLHEDLHATSETQDKMQGGLLLDVVVRQGAPIFQLLASKDEPLLIRGNAFLVLDLGLLLIKMLNSLTVTPEAQHKMQGGLLLDVVVRQGAPIFQLLASKDEPLLIRGNAFLVLDLGLDILNGVTGLNLQGDGLA
ncbi:hypothetical protein N332_06581, partial [Mesitornis unicolor]